MTLYRTCALTVLGLLVAASAGAECTFTTLGQVMYLDGDCTTSGTIYIPDGMTLDGDGHTITAVDPPGEGHFLGGVVSNAGGEAHVTELTVTTDSLANACDGGASRLRGILFDGASGSITHNTVTGINQGASGCQEGNGIEVRNAPFDGSHPDTLFVEVSHNQVTDYQKTGIVCNGDVDCAVEHNTVGASATQDNLAANSIQMGFGALGNVSLNQIDGNQWKGTSNFAATAVLAFQSGDGLSVDRNRIRGNSDVGIYFFADAGTIWNNTVFDEGADHPNSAYDIGIGDWGADNDNSLNKVRGFDTPLSGDEGDRNIVIPSPQN